jgi:hypothetical protein
MGSVATYGQMSVYAPQVAHSSSGSLGIVFFGGRSQFGASAYRILAAWRHATVTCWAARLGRRGPDFSGRRRRWNGLAAQPIYFRDHVRQGEWLRQELILNRNLAALVPTRN